MCFFICHIQAIGFKGKIKQMFELNKRLINFFEKEIKKFKGKFGYHQLRDFFVDTRMPALIQLKSIASRGSDKSHRNYRLLK